MVSRQRLPKAGRRLHCRSPSQLNPCSLKQCGTFHIISNLQDVPMCVNYLGRPWRVAPPTKSHLSYGCLGQLGWSGFFSVPRRTSTGDASYIPGRRVERLETLTDRGTGPALPTCPRNAVSLCASLSFHTTTFRFGSSEVRCRRRHDAGTGSSCTQLLASRPTPSRPRCLALAQENRLLGKTYHAKPRVESQTAGRVLPRTG